MKSRILYGLLLLILVEVFLGGGGRLIDAGPVSIRMLLYALAMAATVWMLYTNQRLSREIIILLSIFSAMLVFGTLIGVLNGANRAFIFEDVKPLLFFYLLPFFYLTLQSFQRLSLVAKVVKISAAVLAGSYVLIFGLVHLNVVPFLDFYHLTLDTGEFFYRGEIAFFYKGFLYLCVGFIFYYFIPDKAEWLIYPIAVAIILTFTRGFLFALSATFLLYYLVVAPDFRFYFAGDTGYSPDFKDIGRRLGPFDLAAIPIGAYEPRWFMGSVHVNPAEAVMIHQDLRARRSLAMHWGTFEMTDESMDEPPRKLAEELAAAGISPDVFYIMQHGQTRRLDSGGTARR